MPTNVRKSLKYKISYKNRPEELELFHADWRSDKQTDRQTDGEKNMAKLMVAFRKCSVKAPWNRCP
jgi:hypothetical protein